MSAVMPRELRTEVSLADAFVLPEEISSEPVRPKGTVREVGW
jgi:hypothetical protein